MYLRFKSQYADETHTINLSAIQRVKKYKTTSNPDRYCIDVTWIKNDNGTRVIGNLPKEDADRIEKEILDAWINGSQLGEPKILEIGQ